MVLDEVINIIESVAPREWQEAWDNTGLQVGNRNEEVTKALLAIDVTPSVVKEAVDSHCDVIISHHPLLFHGLKQVCGQTPQAQAVEMAIKNGIAIYSSHTAMDAYLHGVSGRLAEAVGIVQYDILIPSSGSSSHGLGVIGNYTKAIPFETLLQRIQETLHTRNIRYTPAIKKEVQRIALCGGAGAEFIGQAIEQGADVYVTADVKYHDFLDANGQIAVINLDHWVSEQFVRNVFRDLLREKVETVISKQDTTPVQVYP